jgi:teichoic acid transport system permease protein
MIPARWMWLFKLNPMYYIVDGYRETLINGHPFWQHYLLMTQFWLVTFAAFVCGALVFNRLRPHLADVI